MKYAKKKIHCLKHHRMNKKNTNECCTHKPVTFAERARKQTQTKQEEGMKINAEMRQLEIVRV